MLTISVKNFGPIAEGSVDLKPLTIFVGPSNTGKSYMATAVYAVMRAVEGRPQVPYIRNLDRRGIPVSINNRWKASDELADTIREWVSLQEGKTWDPEEQLPVSAMPQAIQAALMDSTRQVLELYREDVIKRLNYNFGDISSLINRTTGHKDFTLNIRRNEPLLDMDLGLTESNKADPNFDISRALTGSNLIENWGPDYQKDIDISPNLYHDFFFSSRILTADFALGEFPLNSYYLPAARSGIIGAHKVLAASIVRQSSAPDSQRMGMTGLPGLAAEFLSDLLSLGGDRLSPKARLSDAVSYIERNVVHGEIDLNKSGRLPLPEIAYETSAGSFTLEHTSSMVSELAPLVLFLKYLVRPGDLLILEEPESHLHPAAQLQMARGIARLVNAGVQVLITTHSDIMISQINNLLALRQASPELVENSGFEPEDFLQQDQVGAYLFRYNQELGGCETVPLEIDPDTGIDEDEFAAVFEGIYDESIELQRDRN